MKSVIAALMLSSSVGLLCCSPSTATADPANVLVGLGVVHQSDPELGDGLGTDIDGFGAKIRVEKKLFSNLQFELEGSAILDSSPLESYKYSSRVVGTVSAYLVWRL